MDVKKSWIYDQTKSITELRDTAGMYFQMVASLSCGVFAYTMPERKILICNKEAQRLLNIKPYDENALRASFEDNVVWEDRESFAAAIGSLKKVGDSCEYKYRLHTDSGILTVECQTKLMAFENGGKYILSVMQDVTDKELVEYMLKRERQQYREAVISNSEYDFRFDVTDGMVNHDVTYRDGKTFSKVYGLHFPVHYDELAKAWKEKKTPQNIVYDKQNSTVELLAQYERGVTHISCEYFIPDTNRYYRRIVLLSRDDLTGHVMAIVFANDITDYVRESARKGNELAMVNHHLTKQIEITQSFSSLFFASWEVNLKTGRISEISVPDWAKRIYEQSQGDYEAAAKTFVGYFVSMDYKHAMQAFMDINTLQARTKGEKVVAYEYQSTINGWCSANFIPSKWDSQGHATNLIFAVRNVDEEKKKELNASKALHDAYDAANRASAAKTDFLASMSHDIRTPMNAIIGMTTIAKNHLDDRERVVDCLEKITVSSNHLLGLINEVLDMNKIESGKLELVSENIQLSQLIDNIMIMSKPQIEEKKHQVTLKMNDVKHDFVMGDSMRIQQVFMNLMSNAIKYTPDGGKIMLTVSEKPTNNDRVGCFEFILTDNGIGMDEAFQKKMFEPFSRADDERVGKTQGTGLGMAITKNIVGMMNGDIKLESEPERGTTFTVTIFLKLQNQENALPEAEDDSRVAVDRSKDTLDEFRKKYFKGKRALLVEDNEMNAEIATEILGMTGLEIECETNGRLAVERIREVPDGYYDIVFMDIMMPVMNGYDATRAIREMQREYTQELPIIAMTANAFAEDVQAAKNAGMNEHVAKPLDLEQLLKTLDKWVGGGGT